MAKDVIEALEAPSTAIIPSEIFDYFGLSDIYSFFFQMTNDSKYTNKAIEYLMEIKDQDELSMKGKALTRTQIGYNYFLLHNYTEAIKFLLDSHEYEVTQISMVYLAESYLEKGFEQEAKNSLYTFSVDNIKEEDLVDFLIVMSKFLLKYPDYEKFTEIHAKLKSIDFNVQPYFNIMIKDILLQLLEMYNDSNIKSDKVR